MIRAEPSTRRASSRLPSVTTQILIGLVLGVVVGAMWPAFGAGVKPIADAFLRLIKMIIAPLVFSTLVVGIAGTGDLKAMGRIGLKAILYFEAATTIALFLGLGLVNVFQPGAGLALPAGADRAAAAGLVQNQQHGWTSSCTCSRRPSSTRWRAATSSRSSSSRRSSAWPSPRSASAVRRCSTCSTARRT
jgi:L-cystine uptake protein TcyP (sodium:dicarboxylate symporter family)